MDMDRRSPVFVKIAKYVVLAQVASDGGKHIDRWDRNNPEVNRAWQLGYKIKQTYIDIAMKLIEQNPLERYGWRYYKEHAPDQHGNDSCIFYFEFRDEWNEMRQISFHGFPKDKTERGRVTKWNHIKDGSYDACVYLVNSLDLFDYGYKINESFYFLYI